MLAPLMGMDEPPEAILRLGEKYGWSDEAFAEADDKLVDICAVLDVGAGPRRGTTSWVPSPAPRISTGLLFRACSIRCHRQ